MRPIALSLAAVLVTAVGGCSGDVWKGTSEQGEVEFEVLISRDGDDAPFVAEVSIRNRSEEALTFPTPMVMPLCGETNSNCLRVYDAEGKPLRLVGEHKDFLVPPVTRVGPGSLDTRNFVLDESFPDLARPGKYEVEFWYFSEEDDPATWNGRVAMARIPIER